MTNFDRRRFLKTGILGATGALGYTSNIMAGTHLKEEKRIITRTLGKTGLQVPVVSMGVMNSDSPALVRAALDHGIILFDTANSYQNGRNEEMLGNVLNEYPRNSFLIATKVRPAGADRMTGLPSKETTAEDFLSKFDESLKRLKMDYVDILYVHQVLSPEMVGFKPIIKAMKKLRDKGKIRFLGISTHNLPRIIDSIVKTGSWDVVLTTYNYLNTELIRDRAEPPVKGMDIALQKAADAGLGIVAMKTLAGGGFLDREKTKPINASAAIKWVLSNPNVHTTIPGMTNFDQLYIDVKILEDITLNDQEKKDILLARSETGMYCTSCRNCIPGCTKNLPVPDFMRAYMYAYGYSNLEKAYSLITELSAGDNPCSECDSCSASCSRNFNLKEKISDISRLANVPRDFIA